MAPIYIQMQIYNQYNLQLVENKKPALEELQQKRLSVSPAAEQEAPSIA